MKQKLPLIIGLVGVIGILSIVLILVLGNVNKSQQSGAPTPPVEKKASATTYSTTVDLNNQQQATGEAAPSAQPSGMEFTGGVAADNTPTPVSDFNTTSPTVTIPTVSPTTITPTTVTPTTITPTISASTSNVLARANPTPTSFPSSQSTNTLTPTEIPLLSTSATPIPSRISPTKKALASLPKTGWSQPTVIIMGFASAVVLLAFIF